MHTSGFKKTQSDLQDCLLNTSHPARHGPPQGIRVRPQARMGKGEAVLPRDVEHKGDCYARYLFRDSNEEEGEGKGEEGQGEGERGEEEDV